MNPRVSRSSALASKATGFPIAKIAAKLAVGYRLDEVMNDITGVTPASFEPTIDYVVVKIPRFAFEKFSGVPPVLGTKMQSVGEVMALGRTFTESVQKACRSLETGRLGLNGDPREPPTTSSTTTSSSAGRRWRPPTGCSTSKRRCGAASRSSACYEASGVDPWFLDQIVSLVEERAWLVSEAGGPAALARADWRRVKRAGFSDAQLAYLWGPTREPEVRSSRRAAGVTVTYKTVDTCAAEFAARTPYHYSTWEDEDEVAPLERPAVVILGSGPNRIGQGIEFDYCCVHAAFELSGRGLRDRDGQLQPGDRVDRLRHLGPAVLRAAHAGGRPQRLRRAVLEPPRGDRQPRRPDAPEAGPRPGGRRHRGARHVSPDSIDLAEDRERFNALCDRLGIPQPPGGVATEVEGALAVADRVEYPVLVRPSYVLGGRAMEIVYDDGGPTGGHGGARRLDRGRRRRGPLRHPARPHRPVPGGRHRGRRRRGARRRRRGPHRRRHGAHRRGRRALRRLGLRHSAADPARRRRGGHRDATPGRWPKRSACRRCHQRAVRREGRHRLHPRGQPPGQPHGPVRVQGHRRAPGQGRRPADGRRHPRPNCGRKASSRPTPAPTAAATWPSRKRRCPSTASASTPSSAPRCARPAR